jgi:chromate transporter
MRQHEHTPLPTRGATGESPRGEVDGARPAIERSSLGAFLRYFLYLGAVGFGGPIALVGYMQRDLVDARQWISRDDYREGLALAQLAPGPLAAQLAMYLGWVRARVLGATLVGVAFIAPSFAMVLALSVLYLRFGGLPWMRGVFYGIGAAVIAIIARSAVKLVRMTARRDWLLWRWSP